LANAALCSFVLLNKSKMQKGFGIGIGINMIVMFVMFDGELTLIPLF
jgi:hypothetical protein